MRASRGKGVEIMRGLEAALAVYGEVRRRRFRLRGAAQGVPGDRAGRQEARRYAALLHAAQAEPLEDDAYKILQARPARAAAAYMERADDRDRRHRRAAPLRSAGADKRPRAGRQGGRRPEGRRPRQRRAPHRIRRISEISRKPEKKRRAARPGALLGRSRLGPPRSGRRSSPYRRPRSSSGRAG